MFFFGTTSLQPRAHRLPSHLFPRTISSALPADVFRDHAATVTSCDDASDTDDLVTCAFSASKQGYHQVWPILGKMIFEEMLLQLGFRQLNIDTRFMKTTRSV